MLGINFVYRKILLQGNSLYSFLAASGQRPYGSGGAAPEGTNERDKKKDQSFNSVNSGHNAFKF